MPGDSVHRKPPKGLPMNRRMNTFSRLCAIALFVFSGASAQAADADAAAEREVLGVVDALFSAMVKHDVEASRKLILPGANFVVVRPDRTLVVEHDSDYLESLGKHKEVLLERIWDAKVDVQGDIAQVWAPYDFHLDGKLSHCGIDSFSLVRGTDGWRIAGISYSVQTQDCAPSPLDGAK